MAKQIWPLKEITPWSLDNKIIPHTTQVKYLGIFLNSNLKFNHHINYILSRASRTLGLLRHTLYDATLELKKLAYYSLCRPILEYGYSEVWDPVTKDLALKLELLQNKAIRFIFKIKGRDISISKLKKDHHIQTLQKRRQDLRLSTYLKILEYDFLFPSLKCTINSMSANPSTRGSSLLPLACNCKNTNIYPYSFLSSPEPPGRYAQAAL